jgi:hypothetical protein
MEWSDARSLAAFSPLVLSLREDNHHRVINLGLCTTTVCPQDKTNHHDSIVLLKAYGSYTYE